MSDFVVEVPTLIGEVVRPSALRPGQHIFTYRRFGVLFYSHHGDGIVIHLSRTRSNPLLLPSCSSSQSEKPPCEKFGPPGTSGGVLSGSVVRICLDCFCSDGSAVRPVRVYRYGQLWLGVPGTGTAAAATRSSDQVVETARAFLLSGEFGDYSVLHNNCEHFATLCVTGERISQQADLSGRAIWHGLGRISSQVIKKRTRP